MYAKPSCCFFISSITPAGTYPQPQRHRAAHQAGIQRIAVRAWSATSDLLQGLLELNERKRWVVDRSQ